MEFVFSSNEKSGVVFIFSMEVDMSPSDLLEYACDFTKQMFSRS